MSTASKIEWTDTTWNPTTGCDRVSPGCDHCYAMTLAKRLKGMGQAKYQTDGDPRTSGPGFGVAAHPGALAEPFGWRKPRRVFVNSMSDLFHEKVDVEFIARVFAVMSLAEQHTFQVLTKRHARMRSLLSSQGCFGAAGDFVLAVGDYRRYYQPDCGDFRWPLPNVWLGVSAEDQHWADIRIPALLATPAAVRFVSAEPLLGPIDLTRWIGDSHGAPVEPRGRRLSGSPGGGAPDRSGGADLEGGRSPLGSMDRQEPPVSMPPSQSGERHGQVLAGTGDVRGGSSSRPGASAGLETLRGHDPRRLDGQPQEWHPHGQPAEQLGTDDLRAADRARAHHPAAGPARSVRPAESDGEIVHGAGARDLFPASIGRTSDGDRAGLWRRDADDLEDRTWRPTISWVICGGESGPGARPMHPGWVGQLRDQCTATGTAFFFKQWGDWRPQPIYSTDDRHHVVMTDGRDRGTPWPGWKIDQPDAEVMERVGKARAGRELDGRTWDEYPGGAQ